MRGQALQPAPGSARRIGSVEVVLVLRARRAADCARVAAEVDRVASGRTRARTRRTRRTRSTHTIEDCRAATRRSAIDRASAAPPARRRRRACRRRSSRTRAAARARSTGSRRATTASAASADAPRSRATIEPAERRVVGLLAAVVEEVDGGDDHDRLAERSRSRRRSPSRAVFGSRCRTIDHGGRRRPRHAPPRRTRASRSETEARPDRPARSYVHR